LHRDVPPKSDSRKAHKAHKEKILIAKDFVSPVAFLGNKEFFVRLSGMLAS